MTLHAIAECQKAGGIAAFIDAGTLDTVYARALGVKVDELLISQQTLVNSARIADTLVRSGAIDMIVVDSVGPLVPRQKWMGTWVTCSLVHTV